MTAAPVCLVVSDIHGNIDALEAVLADATADGWTGVICLGDLVGYGAAPREVITRLRALAPEWSIRGNHDRVCAGLTSASLFSPVARAAIEWTRDQLTSDELALLATLSPGPLPFSTETLLCHGAPQDEDFYVLDPADARLAFAVQRARLCLHGHTHAQTVFRLNGPALLDETPARRTRCRIPLTPDSRWLVNPGSVGQPRDGDPRAAYAILDAGTMTIELRRVPYDISRAQARIRQAGLPDMLARRLEDGT